MKKTIACFFATSGHSGVDRVMHRLLPAIISRGYQVDLLHVEDHGPVFDPLPDGMQLIELGSRHVYTCAGAVKRYLQQNHPLALLCDKDRVNRTAVYAHWRAASNAHLVLRSGTTISVDTANRKPLDRWLQKQSMHYLYHRAWNIITPSIGAADDMANFANIKRQRITTVASPVLGEHIVSQAGKTIEHRWLGENKTCPVILGVGELSPRKDFSTLIRAFAQVRAQRECRLIIVGRGKQQTELESLAQQLGVEKDVELAGFHANPYPWFMQADVFALTSRWEGMPIVLIEALSLAIPSVACDCPSGPSEILQQGRIGELAPVGDDVQVAAGILKQLDNPVARQDMINAVQPYTIENSTTTYLQAMGLAPYAE